MSTADQCVDTPDWHNGYAGANSGLGWTCLEYAQDQGWCANGDFTTAGVSAGAGGVTYRYPEDNCCACGKQTSGSGLCIPNPCANNGICYATSDTTAQCDCSSTGYTGTTCST
ncbi:unnamed protein product, partial [Didymodactylos carnosus]